MSFDEFAWRTVVLATANGIWMWLAIMLFDFGNERNKLPAAILWSVPFSGLLHAGFVYPLTYVTFIPFWFLASVIFYRALLKWYDLEIGQTLKVAFVTLVLDAGTYIALSRIGILPPFSTASIAFQPVLV